MHLYIIYPQPIHIYRHTYIQVVGVISKIAEHKTSIEKESVKDLKTGSPA